MPDWLCDFVEKHSTPSKPRACHNVMEVADDFDFDDMMDFYGIGIVCEKDDVWEVVEECPGVGYRHEGSTLTAFYWDGSSLGWSCFAQGCPLHGKSIGQVIAFLNARKGEPYKGIIWEKQGDELLNPKWGFEILDDDEPECSETEPVIENSPAVSLAPRADDYAAGFDELLMEQKLSGDIAWTAEDFQPKPNSIAITDPRKHEGLEFPGDCAMYGRLAAIAKRHDHLQQGWLYPSLLLVKVWRAIEGPAREVFFAQQHPPGRLGASDFTHMEELGVTIQGQSFPHLIYHFVLTYSNWEAATVCFSESFESLSEGLQNALWALGKVPQRHRTDRLGLQKNAASFTTKFIVTSASALKTLLLNRGESH